MSLTKTKLVFCFSNESYDAKIWTNKQHLMSRLSKLEGYKIVYIDQGMSTRYLKQAISELDFKYFFMPLRRENKNLWVFSPFFLPLIKGGTLKKISWRLLNLLLNTFSAFVKHDAKLYWVYQPQAWYLINRITNNPNKVLLYDCVDEFATHPFYKNDQAKAEELIEIEPKLVSKCDLVVTTSKALHKDKLKDNLNSHCVHNVGDFNHFKQANHQLTVKDNPWIDDQRIKLIYAGVIDDYKTDLELIIKTATSLSESHLFIFIGPIRITSDTREKELKSYNNILLLGPKPYLEVPDYLHAADILWLPYKYSSHTNRVFPLKLFEYMSTGKSIIARSLNSFEDYANLFDTYDDETDLVQLIREYQDTNERKHLRIEVASKNTWENRLEKILGLVNEV